jgi:hypothetical protein
MKRIILHGSLNVEELSSGLYLLRWRGSVGIWGVIWARDAARIFYGDEKNIGIGG